MVTAIQSPDPEKAILVADDEPEIRGYIETALRCRGYAVETAPDGEEALERVQAGGDKFSLVLLDVFMPRQNGLEALRHIRRLDPQLPVIMLSGASSTVTVVEAMKSGATDFLAKPITHHDLGSAVEKALAESVVSRPIEPYFPVQSLDSLSFMPMKDIESILARIGASSVPVLLQGETGVGKEIVARRLHESNRAGKPFLKLNCAALPSELVESELFGYERGAFTGAFQRKPGMFELAHGGTLLLDEIGDMEFKLQSKLLQVLQDQEFQRVGGRQNVRVDVRVLAATHCDLYSAVAEKRFRGDLYYRLNVVSIRIPPLRERKEEIIPLAEFMLSKHAPANGATRLPAELRRALIEYSWPGNVRELDNIMRRWLVLRESRSIVEYLQSQGAWDSAADICDAPGGMDVTPPSAIGSKASGLRLSNLKQATKTAETKTILAALDAARWNRKKAARSLGMDYRALLYKMKKFDITGDAVE